MATKLTDLDLERFLRAQRTAQGCVRRVASELVEGATESEVANQLRTRALELGAEGFFHFPVVLFGERAAFGGMQKRRDVFPGPARLRAGEAVVLDVAPVFEGCAVDVSYTTSIGELPVLEEGKRVLTEIRAGLPDAISTGRSARELYAWVARACADRGWTLIQENYLFGALAHRVYRLPRSRFARKSFVGLGVPSAARLFGQALLHRVPLTGATWPFWNDSPRSDAAPAHGLWSFEPHIESGGFGLKWEELLVLDARGARWLEAAGGLI